MNTENFDDAFRRKVESFHPPFRDDEIDRIQGYVSKHIPLSFWQRFGHIMTYSLGTIIIISLLTSTLYQANENKNLLNKISDLNKKLKQKQATIVVNSSPKSIIITKTDTVYVVKHIKKEVFSVENSSISTIENEVNPKFSIENKDNFAINMDLSESENSVADIAKKENKKSKISKENQGKNKAVEVGETSKKSSEFRNENKLLKDYSSEKNSLANISNTSKILNERNSFSDDKNISETTNTVQDVAESEDIKTESNQLTINSLKYKNYKSIDISSILDLSNRKSWMPKYVSKPKEKSSFKFPSIALPNLKYTVGLGTNIGYEQAGTSLLTDILFAKRWSVTSGINVSLLGSERFKNEDDFKRHKDQSFRDQYTVNVPIGSSIENIETHQILFNVPLYLNYRYPLRNDFTALFTTGTDLDFHLQQFTSYSHFDFSRDDKQALQQKIPVTPFNNWLISAGVEKCWNHFSLQFSPYFSTKFKNVSYRKDDFSFGFKLNGFYRLSR